MKNKIFLIISFFPIIFLIGCATPGISLKADKVSYPVSITKFVHDDSMRIISKSDYVVIDEFSFNANRYMALNLKVSKDTIDISEKLNDLIKSAHGNAIVNMKITGETVGWLGAVDIIPATATGFLVGSHIKDQNDGFWGGVLAYTSGLITSMVTWALLPRDTKVKVSGEIIKYKNSSPTLRTPH